MNLGRSSRWMGVAFAAALVAPTVAEAGPRRTRAAGPFAATPGVQALKSDESVQRALAAAPAGGVVQLPFGAFRAAIVIDRPMTVVADPRGTRLDPKGLGVPAITVLPGVTDVTLHGLYVTAADGDGIVTGAGCDRLRVSRVVVERSGRDGLHVADAADVRLEACVFDRNAGDGLDLTARRATVTSCSFRENGGAAARLAGADVTLTSSSFAGGAEGVVFEGERLVALRSTFRGTRLVARFAAGADTCGLERSDARDLATLAVTEAGSTYNRIAGNRAAGTTGDALVLAGTWQTVEDNVLGRVLGTAVVGDGLSLRVLDNAVTSAAGNAVRMTGMGNTVEGNVLGPCGGDAVVVEGTAALVARNVVSGGRGTGFVLEGDHHQVVANRVTDVPGAGIRLEGDANLLQDNRLQRAGQEGIVVAGRGNQLLANRIALCGGRGLADDGEGTVLERNRID